MFIRMKIFWNIIFVCVLLLGVLPVRAADDEVPADIIQQASFADDPRISSPTFAGRQAAGFTLYEINGWGLNYKRAITEQNTLWMQFNLKKDSRLFTEIPEYGDPFPNSEVVEKNRYLVVAGMDRIFHLTENKYWGFVLGLGAGFAASEYQTKHYPSMCRIICGYDPRNPTVVDQRDDYAFISARLGVSVLQTIIWGVKGDVNFGIYPELVRTSEKPRFVNPAGGEVRLHNFVAWAFEYSVEL